MLGWDLNKNDAHPVRISDPHFQQAPRFPLGCTRDLHCRRLQALVFGSEIPDLNPQGEIASGSPIPDTRDLQVTSAEKENHPRILPVTELTADGKTESVPVETLAPVPVGRSQQDPATKDVHRPIIPPVHRRRPLAP